MIWGSEEPAPESIMGVRLKCSEMAFVMMSVSMRTVNMMAVTAIRVLT
jgi:hypothetical protein